MKKTLLSLGAFVIMSFGFHEMTYKCLPNYIYQKFYQKAIGAGLSYENVFSIIQAPDETSRLVVKPNPDFAYGSAFYNISESAIRLTGQMPEASYWSVALYQPNTINYYVKNDLQFGSFSLDIVLTTDKLDGIQQEQIISPSNKGFILIRVLVEDRTTQGQHEIMKFLKTLEIHEIDSSDK